MSSLTTIEKKILEKLFQMEKGYCLNFSDRTIDEFFQGELGVNLYTDRYECGSGSKANRVRRFWQIDVDQIVTKSIVSLLEYLENEFLLGNLIREDFDRALIERANQIAERLSGKPAGGSVTTDADENDFLNRKIEDVSLDKLGLKPEIKKVIQARIDEVKICLQYKAPLSAIFLCGSALEGLLLATARANQKDFNSAQAVPKFADKPKQFHQWKLSEFIDVACEVGAIERDVKNHSHSLRDFRNYIHPHQQVVSGFNPHEHSAKIAWQVLQAAIFELSNFQTQNPPSNRAGEKE